MIFTYCVAHEDIDNYDKPSCFSARLSKELEVV